MNKYEEHWAYGLYWSTHNYISFWNQLVRSFYSNGAEHILIELISQVAVNNAETRNFINTNFKSILSEKCSPCKTLKVCNIYETNPHVVKRTLEKWLDRSGVKDLYLQKVDNHKQKQELQEIIYDKLFHNF